MFPTSVAQQLPDRLGDTMLRAAYQAFVNGMQLTSALAAVVAVALAVLAFALLRDEAAPAEAAEPDEDTTFAECGR